MLCLTHATRDAGLSKAAHHNGKIGKISRKKGENGRVGVELGGGEVCSCIRL